MTKCVKFTNIEDFPNVALVGAVTGPMIYGYTSYLIKQDSCLSGTYWANKLHVLWTYQDHLDSVGLDSLDIASIIDTSDGLYKTLAGPAVFLLTDEINPSGGYIPDTDPLESREEFYTLFYNFDQGKLDLWKSKELLKYNDGTPDKTVTYEPPASISTKPVQSTGPGQSIKISSTHIHFTVPQKGRAMLIVYNLAGQKVYSKSLVCKSLTRNQVPVPSLASGMYILNLEGENFKASSKLVVNR
jgi:hypothetical protein